MSLAETLEKRAEQFVARYGAVREEIGRVIVGHHDIVHGILTCLFVGGHCLLEGVPGLGKTLLVRTMASVLRRLGKRDTSRDSRPALTSSPSLAGGFVGRSDELLALRGALSELDRGRAIPVVVEGPSGVGKSALVRYFTEEAMASVLLDHAEAVLGASLREGPRAEAAA